MVSVRFEGGRDFPGCFDGLGHAFDGFEFLASHGCEDRGDDGPDHGDDDGGPAQAHEFAEGVPEGDGEEQEHEVPGDAGAGEHAAALAGAGAGLLEFGFCEFDFLPDQGGQVPGDLAEEVTEGGGVGLDVRGRMRGIGYLAAHRGRPPPSVSSVSRRVGSPYSGSSYAGSPIAGSP